jgi:hypothetical protein
MSIDWSKLKTAEQKETERLESLANTVRAERDKRLAATDFYLLPDAPQAPTNLLEYRQALRDLPQADGFPESVEWPTLGCGE